MSGFLPFSKQFFFEITPQEWDFAWLVEQEVSMSKSRLGCVVEGLF